MTYHLLISLCAHLIGQEPECTEPYTMRDYRTGRVEEYSTKDSCRAAKTSAVPYWNDALNFTNQDRTKVRGSCVEAK